MPRRVLALLVLAVVAMFSVAACDQASPAATSGAYKVSPTDAVAMIKAGDRTVIDVRTPAEYASGHVAGAVNIDVEAADFGDQIAELDHKAPYMVYCRSGNRSAIAAKQMADAGFTDVADAGGLSDLVAAGAPTE
jgi:phage shock protein E